MLATAATAATTATTAATTVSGPLGGTADRLQGRSVWRLGTQHPEPADVQGHAGRHARPGKCRPGRGQGYQWRGRVGQAV